MADMVGELMVRLTADVRSLHTDLNKARSDVQQFANTTEQLMTKASSALRQVLNYASGYVLGNVLMRGVSQLTAFAQASVMMGARVGEMNVVLQNLGGASNYSTRQINEQVKGIKALGITTTEAQNTIAQFLRYQLNLTKAGELARVAQDAAVLSQSNSSDTLKRLVWGIQTLQPEVLRTAGLTISLEQAYRNFAKTAHKTVEELTPLERQNAALNEVLAEGVKIQGTYESAMTEPGKRFRSLDRLVKDLQENIGTALKPGFGGFVIVMEGILNRFKALTAAGAPLAEALTEIGQNGAKFFGDLAKNINGIDGNELAAIAREAGKFFFTLAETVQRLAALFIQFAKALSTLVIPSMQLLAGVAGILTGVLSKHPALIWAIVGVWAAFKSLRIADTLVSIVTQLRAVGAAKGLGEILGLVTTGVGVSGGSLRGLTRGGTGPAATAAPFVTGAGASSLRGAAAQKAGTAGAGAAAAGLATVATGGGLAAAGWTAGASLAIGLAVAGIGVWISKNQQASAAAKAHKTTVDDLAVAIGKAGDAGKTSTIDEWAKGRLAADSNKLGTLAFKTGYSDDLTTRALSGDVGAMAEIKARADEVSRLALSVKFGGGEGRYAPGVGIIESLEQVEKDKRRLADLSGGGDQDKFVKDTKAYYDLIKGGAEDRKLAEARAAAAAATALQAQKAQELTVWGRELTDTERAQVKAIQDLVKLDLAEFYDEAKKAAEGFFALQDVAAAAQATVDKRFEDQARRASEQQAIDERKISTTKALTQARRQLAAAERSLDEATTAQAIANQDLSLSVQDRERADNAVADARDRVADAHEGVKDAAKEAQDAAKAVIETEKEHKATVADITEEAKKRNQEFTDFYTKHLPAIAKKSPEIAAELAKMGPAAAKDIAKQLAAASDSEFAALKTQYDKLGGDLAAAMVEGFVKSQRLPAMVAAAAGGKSPAELAKGLGTDVATVERGLNIAANDKTNGQDLSAIIFAQSLAGRKLSAKDLSEKTGIPVDDVRNPQGQIIRPGINSYFKEYPWLATYVPPAPLPAKPPGVSVVAKPVPVPGATGVGTGFRANGGVFANGENHVAAMAYSQRLWAEPETMGEAYIPLALAKRARSVGILSQVAGQFGFGLMANRPTAMATGGLFGGNDDRGTVSTSVARSPVEIHQTFNTPVDPVHVSAEIAWHIG